MNPVTRATRPTVLLALAWASLSAETAFADRIYRTNGTPIEDCAIVQETVDHVVYKEGGRGGDKTIPSEEVVRVEYERVPPLIGEARSSLDEGDVSAAIGQFNEYLDSHLGGSADKRFAWAPAYAAHSLVTLYTNQGNLEEVLTVADKLLANFPESRYAPGAYVAKANALFRLQQFDQAQSTLANFERLIASKGLSKGWALECKLAQVLTDRSSVGEKRRSMLAEIEASAGKDFPTVRNRASVARAAAFLAEESENPESIGNARKIFEEVILDPAADDESLAASYSGLGKCRFLAGNQDGKELEQALLAFMRVVVLYGDQVRYAPEAMFYAGRCFNLMGGEGDDERANRLYSHLIRTYPESEWAGEAKKFRK